MTTLGLIEKANMQAQKIADCFTDDMYDEDGRALIGSVEYKNAVKKSMDIPKYVEFEDIICESTLCFKGNTAYFQNRFYVKKLDGYRGTFSKAKAIQKLG